ncbi:MAG TPA: stage III sporulation protein AA [Firmicutes bacterium]|nr:stage III sporulation protein AA [Bacillota bacterium]
MQKEVLSILPPGIRKLLLSQPEDVLKQVEEIRLGIGKKVMLYHQGRETVLSDACGEHVCSREDMAKLIQAVSNSSLYAFDAEIKQGFISIPGGHRIGLAGKAVIEAGKVKRINPIISVNIRVARQVIGAASPLINLLTDRKTALICHTLIISPPKCGKTTLLRDLARQIGNGLQGFPPQRVGIVDERSELAGSFQGIPQLDVGLRTDVLDNCPKAEGMMMLIRSMGPDVMITDEIGTEKDVAAVREAINAGVTIIASAHAGSFEELLKRPELAKLVTDQVFKRIVLLSGRKGAGTLEMVLDSLGKIIWRED